MFIYSLFNQLIGIQSLNFKRQDLLNPSVNLLIWLQFYDWQCHGMEENNNIWPGDLFSAGVSCTRVLLSYEFPISTSGVVV